ncbi:flavin-containing monooxygenase 5-like [Ixodes scapularis]|uniref:flavin-containing monooxygenase 5-like n=1 Tax=Ixodes scapularis TaxID=6945 RepID=UPI001C388019|nr:flavin-containing monooxygenase 5-like [Ixodes scapularis]
MRVAVIGAGCCGITAVKACLEENLDVVCFERSSNSGGLWWYRDDEQEPGRSTVMRFTVTNTSKEMSAYSDFPPMKEMAVYMTHGQTLRYIRSYAEHFGVPSRIRYRHHVIRLGTDGTLTVLDLDSGREFEETFDSVLVCTGHHATPSIPKFPGLEKFKGRVLHSQQYKYADEGFRDKRTAVVGFGISGADVAVDLTTVTDRVLLVTRRMSWIYPQHIGGVPTDAYILNQLRLWIYSWLPPYFFSRHFQRICNQEFDHKLLGTQPPHPLIKQAGIPNHILPLKLLAGSIELRANLEAFTENGMVFNGVEEPIDAVVFSTGYTNEVPFARDILPAGGQRLPLYKRMIPPKHPNIAFLGYIDASLNLSQGFEMQARYMASVLTGKLTLPSTKVMQDEVLRVHDLSKRQFLDTPRHYLMVDRVAYVNDLARAIGAKPKYYWLFLTDIKLWWTLITSPLLNYQYRLRGPNAWPGAREAILGYAERVRAPLQVSMGSRHQVKKRRRLKTWGIVPVVAIVIISISVKSLITTAAT